MHTLAIRVHAIFLFWFIQEILVYLSYICLKYLTVNICSKFIISWIGKSPTKDIRKLIPTALQNSAGVNVDSPQSTILNRAEKCTQGLTKIQLLARQIGRAHV